MNLFEYRKGIILGFFAYLIWGSFPAFFKLLPAASPLEVVCHRIFWSAIFLLVLVVFKNRTGVLLQAIRHGKTILTLCCSTLLIATNWLTFLFAIQAGEVLQSSLGYFITPLLSVLFGFIFLSERLNRMQQVSFLFATSGVLYIVFGYGQTPWISFVIAASFGLYGLLRKVAKIDALIGLTIETMLLVPVAAGYLYYLSYTGQSVFGGDSLRYNILLPVSGVITAIPLLFFIGAAKRLQLSTIGFMQYITPSLHFILAIIAFSEPFSRDQFLSFMLIWVGLAIYSFDIVKGSGKKSCC